MSKKEKQAVQAKQSSQDANFLKSYSVVFETETRVFEAHTLENAISKTFGFIVEFNQEPKHLILPSGEKLFYSWYAAHQFAAKGRITEEEFLNMSREFGKEERHA